MGTEQAVLALVAEATAALPEPGAVADRVAVAVWQPQDVPALAVPGAEAVVA